MGSRMVAWRGAGGRDWNRKKRGCRGLARGSGFVNFPEAGAYRVLHNPAMYPAFRASWGRSRDRLVQTAAQHFLPTGVPALFALFVFAVVRQHSWSPIPTLALVTGYCFGISAAMFWGALLRGAKVSLPPGIATPLWLLAQSVLVSLFMSIDLQVAVRHLMLYLAISMLGCAVYLLYREERRIPVAAFCVSLALVNLPFVVEVMLWIRDTAPPLFTQSPQVPNFVHVRQFGEFGFVAAVCGTGFIVLTRRWTLSGWLLTCVALFGLVATGSRGALLCWVVFAGLLLVFGTRRIRLAGLSLTALATSSAAVWYLHSSGLLETPNVFGRLLAITSGSATFDSGRLEMWREVLLQVAQYPLFGQGPDAYVQSGCCLASVRQPHNFALQFLMEFGIVGCVAAAFVMWRLVGRMGGVVELLRKLRSSPESTMLASALAAYVAYGLIDGVFYHPLPMICFALFCGLTAALLQKGHNGDGARVPHQDP